MLPSASRMAGMEQSGPPSFVAWSRPSAGVDEDWPVGRNQTAGMAGASVRHMYRNTATSWTSLGNDVDDPLTDNSGSAVLSQQSLLLQEYNRLAEKHGLRPLLFREDINEEQDGLTEQDGQPSDRRNWFARTFGKPPVSTSRRSSRHSIDSRTGKGAKHKRSDSDPTSQAQVPHSSKSDATDTLKNQTLQTLIRVCGKSFLYLPSEYATRSLMLPTCFRAAAQYLVQNGPETRGIFRVSGSMRVINELYDYYCINLDDDEDIAATVRSPNLPFHIKASVHDVASMFKRLLAGLPGGILGHLLLFEALIEIQKTGGQPRSEGLRASGGDQAHTKARLIALAIESVPSPFQRELICAVFGLLSLIGHAAETAPFQNTQSSSLPHSEKMGYAALGIIFGPLLMGDLLDSYSQDSQNDPCFSSSASANPSFPDTSSPRSKADKRRKSIASDKYPLSALPSTLDKILLANGIAEMMITHWRGVVCQMKTIGIMRKESMLQQQQQQQQRQQCSQQLPRSLRPTRSETFTDQSMGAVVQQESQLYSSHLRKARSASNTRSPSSTINANQPLPGLTSQRPADMTFEEFAARKRLRNYASSMSVASDSTYAAVEPQPVKALSPPEEDPFFVPNTAAVQARSGTAKLTKQRRMSGGFSSIFGDKSASPSKDSPKISRKAVRPLEENIALSPQCSDKVASPWNVSLSPVKARGTAMHQINGDVKASGSPKKATPRRAYQESDVEFSFESEPISRAGIEGTPQSKTAALIAKIMNTRQQTTPVQFKKSKAGCEFSSRNEKAQKTSEKAPKTPNSKTGRNEHDSPIGRQNNGDAATPRSRGQWTRRIAAPVASSENQAINFSAVATPTPKRQRKAKDASATVDDRGRPRANSKDDGQSSTPRIADSKDSLRIQSSMSSPGTSDSPPSTPQKRLVGGFGLGPDSKGFSAARSDDKPPKRIGDQGAVADLTANISPISKAKHHAQGLTRAHSKTFSTSAMSKSALEKPLDGHHDTMEAKSPAVGNSVKAMAAMFDSAAWKASIETPPTGPAQMARSLGTPNPSSRLSQYTSNTSPSKSPDFTTPARFPDLPLQRRIGKDESQAGVPASMQRLASERRRLRLSKSEDRNARPGRVGRLAANEQRDLIRSVDRKDVVDTIRRNTLDLGKGGDGMNDAQQNRHARERSNKTPRTKGPSSAVQQNSGSDIKAKRLGDHNSTPVRRGISTPSRSVECQTILSPPPKPVPAVTSTDRSKSVQDLEHLLDSKTVECENWKTRAEAAEKRLAEFELSLADSDGDGGVRNSYGSLGDKNKHEPFVTVTGQNKDRDSWSWQDLLPTTTSIHLSQENLEATNVAQDTDGAKSTLGRAAPYLQRDSDMDDGTISETSTTTVVVRGRLSNERLLPFAMYNTK